MPAFAGEPPFRMPIAKTSFLRATAILLLIAFVALVVIVGTAVWLVERNEAYFDQVLQARDARTTTVALRQSIQEMESGQRGYLLTNDEAYLEFYGQARDDILPQYEDMRKALEPYWQNQDELVALRTAVEAKIAEMEETVTLAKEGRREEALALVRTDRGKRLMDNARELFRTVIQDADRRVIEGARDQRRNTSALRWVTILGGLIIIGVIGGAVWIVMSYTGELVRARSEVEVLNTSLEERVNERTEELIRANEEIQRFAYIVTHDLRAPLVNIMGFTSELDETMQTIQSYVLADGDPLSEQEIKDARTAAAEDLPEAIGFIRASTRKMDGLINAILKISREGRRALKPEKIDLNALLENAAATVQHQVSETEGEITVDAKGPAIVSDRLSLEQIFGNLLDNAVKYRSPTRPIRIDITGKQDFAGRISLDFTDNGRGIATQDHERVFDLFRRAGTQDQPGEGIGLAHVRTLVRSLGGDIRVKSELGEGTTFTVTLPKDVRAFLRRNAN